MTHQHVFTDRELIDGYRKQHETNRIVAEQGQKALMKWRTLIEKRINEVCGFILIHKKTKREWKILSLKIFADCSIQVTPVNLRKGEYPIWDADLDEFTVTKRKVTT